MPFVIWQARKGTPDRLSRRDSLSKGQTSTADKISSLRVCFYSSLASSCFSWGRGTSPWQTVESATVCPCVSSARLPEPRWWTPVLLTMVAWTTTSPRSLSVQSLENEKSKMQIFDHQKFFVLHSSQNGWLIFIMLVSLQVFKKHA